MSQPIFLFAASWRTGSTLLQRMLNASDNVFMWGEPNFLSNLRKMYEQTSVDFEKQMFSRKNLAKHATGAWIPRILPSEPYLQRGFRAFFDETFGEEVAIFGKKRWGIKEVRQDAVKNALFLQSLYPEAKFLFLVRDPFKMYKSVKAKPFHKNFKDPFKPVQVWKTNTQDFINEDLIKDLNCMLVTYEELIQDTLLISRIFNFLDLHITEKVILELETKVDSSGIKAELDRAEIEKIYRLTKPLLRHFNYVKPQISAISEKN
ncbi:MAG: sulfotransferase [Deinococcales bacterium]